MFDNHWYEHKVFLRHHALYLCVHDLQAIKLDPALYESYKGNLDAVEEQLRSSSSGPQGGGAGVGAPDGGEGPGLLD